MLSKSGPVDLLTITKILQKIQENMGTSWKHFAFVDMGIKKTFESHIHRFLLEILSTVPHLCIIFCEDEDRKMIKIG